MPIVQKGLPRTMKAIMCHGPEDYRVEQVPVPEAGPGEVVARVLGAGICASDIKCHSGAPHFWGDEFREGYCQPPVIPGHEFVGEVVALGEGLAEEYGLAIGDQVVSEQIVPCWKCRYCLRGQYWMCQVHNIYGFRQVAFGAMAEYMKFPAGALNYKVPKTLEPQEAVYIEPLACAIHAVQRGEIEFGDTVVIAGCGPLGLGMVAAARLKNPGCLVAIDLEDSRLEVAKRCGADIGLNPAGVDVIDKVRKLTVDWTIIGDTKELNIHGAHLGPYCYPLAIDMLAKGSVPTDAIVTHQISLEDYQEGFKLASSGTESIKVMLVP